MNYKELYEKVVNGDYSAVGDLKELADNGDADAQYILYCIYSDVTSPFRDTELAMQWLKKSVCNGSEEAKKTYDQLSPSERLKYSIETKEDFDALYHDAKNIKPGGLFSYYGRITRKTFAITYLPLLCIWIGILCYLLFVLSTDNLTKVVNVEEQPLLLFGYVAWLYIFFCLLTKRFHDCGHTCVIPLIAIALSVIGSVPILLVVIYCLFKKGNPNLNQYGPAK